ncbi:MAG TPA: hypothetical protein VG674_11085 [Amycolatopsis sp.]|uniref:Uncharacterized protein n=1 Tax=Amycolatopsis nalaikhensis TaxID=715472 RepID=A0ABY8XEC2_9PSEU|nr:hypothetical protein [Amycolatopsis sp. 2-2]WIV53960.1 hypothetical protein QP939_34520 [Amycolatopsis sp. 2-2]HWD02984.1 hypothetical protein [Amycolatopsis sp.]
MFTLSALPLAVVLAAAAVVTLRHHAFPAWLGRLAVVAAATHVLLWCGPPSAAGHWRRTAGSTTGGTRRSCSGRSRRPS